jgi:hypothetical protein
MNMSGARGRPCKARPIMTAMHSVPGLQRAWRFGLLRYAPPLAVLSLIWEMSHLRLYTIAHEGDFATQAYAVLHCTGGDVLIGLSSLFAAALLFGRSWPATGHGPVLGAAMLFGVAYTVFSEWLHTRVTLAWQYTEAMPQLPLLGTGLTPFLQWLVIPPVAYALALALERRRQPANIL